MNARIRSTKLLAIAVALVVLAAIWSVWGERPVQAIIIVGGKTGMFTLTQGEAARAHVVNTGGEAGIIIVGGRVADSDGNTLSEFRGRSLALGQAATFEFHPPDPDQPMAVRVELTVQGVTRREMQTAFIPTLEVFETSTGKTSVGQDFIIIVGG